MSYTAGEVGGRIDSVLKQGVPSEIAKMPNLMKVGCIATVSQRAGSDRSTHSSWSGDLLCDDTGQAHNFGKQVTSCAVLPNGKAAVMSDGKGITVVMIPEMTVWKKFDKIGNGSGAHSAVSKDGRKLAVANGYEIEVFDSTTGGSIVSKMKAGETVWRLAFHPDGKHLGDRRK